MSYGPRLISESIPRIAGQAFGRKYIMLGRLVTRWPEIVGTDLAAVTQPVKLRYMKPKDGSKATASLDIATPTAEATALHYRKDLILERINQIFGDRWVTAIRFVPQAANSPARPLKKRTKPLTENEKSCLSSMLEEVKDPDILARLKSLGAAILQDSKS